MTSAEQTVPVDSPGEYAAGLLRRLGDRDVFEVLSSSPVALRAIFDRSDDAAVRRPESPGKWSMMEVAHHLADGEMVVGVRIRMIVAEETPPILAYDQELWAANLRYREATPADVLNQFTTLRDANLRLARQLTPAELQRFGIHTERGGESAGYILRLLAGHDLVHLDQLARIQRTVS